MKIQNLAHKVIMFYILLSPILVNATPVRNITNLVSITFWERSGGVAPTEYSFGVNSSELTTRLSDPLGTSNNDFGGITGEFYDVYYSNSDGSFNLDGEFLTISGAFDKPSPAGGGLNLAEIGLNFSSTSTEFGNFVASFTALGDNADPGSVTNAIDGDLLTHTTMGNNLGQSERLQVTLGFLSSSGPAPASVPAPPVIWLFVTGIIGLIGMKKR